MAGPFTITTQTPTVPLNSQRQGQASYSVTNTSGQPIRGRGRLVTVGQTLSDWLTPVGDLERDFAVGETQTYALQIQVPAVATAGDYVLRLDMVGVTNPDELFSEGPTATFTVIAGPPPPPPVIKGGYLIVVVGGLVGEIGRAHV